MAMTCSTPKSSPSPLLKNFPMDGRPNTSTREILTAQTVCKRWQHVIAARVIKHCGMFGRPPALRDTESEEENSEHIKFSPQMHLATLAVVAAGPLPVSISSMCALF
jgi:hypothetical protein